MFELYLQMLVSAFACSGRLDQHLLDGQVFGIGIVPAQWYAPSGGSSATRADIQRYVVPDT
jgi:hypothetical protein